MEKQSKIPMIYGYAVCLVAVITLLISVTSLVNAIIDLGDPMHAQWVDPKAPSLASFENYKMDILKSGEKEQAYIPDEVTLLAMYNAAKDDRIQSAKHKTNQTIIVNSLLLIICIVLFFTHWRWMRRLSKVEE